MTYTLTRTLPDGTAKAWSTQFATMRKAAQAVAYCLADNGLAGRRDATAFASKFQDTPPGTDVRHESSGYVFRTEKS
jgi:hypothetical protein